MQLEDRSFLQEEEEDNYVWPHSTHTVNRIVLCRSRFLSLQIDQFEKEKKKRKIEKIRNHIFKIPINVLRSRSKFATKLQSLRNWMEFLKLKARYSQKKIYT